MICFSSVWACCCASGSRVLAVSCKLPSSTLQHLKLFSRLESAEEVLLRGDWHSCVDSWSPVSVYAPLRAQCLFHQGVTQNHICWLKMRMILWSSRTGENTEYCIEDHEVKQCLIVKGICFPVLPLVRAPHGCFSASGITCIYLGLFWTGSVLPFVLLSSIVASPEYFQFCSFSTHTLGPCL